MSILKNLKLETKSAWAKFPGLEGFEVHVGAITRELSRKLKDQAQVTKIDPKHKVPVTELDEDKFIEAYAQKAILGWKGLTYAHVEELMLVDTSGIDDMNAQVPYSQENAIELIKGSSAFDNWLNEQVFSLAIFRRDKKDGDTGKPSKVS